MRVKATDIFAEVCEKHNHDIRATQVLQVIVIEMIENALSASDSNQTINKQTIPYQACPICNGSGRVYDTQRTIAYKKCETCGGTKVIPMYLPSEDQ